MGPAAVLLAVSLATTTGFGPQPKLPSILTKWQPPSSAPLPAPLLAGNRTAVFVHAPSVERTQPFSHWFTDDVAATFFGGLEHSSALTDVFLSGGHSLVKASAPIVPTGADADLMTLCTRRLHTMQVRVLPVVSATKDVVVDWISQSDENKVSSRTVYQRLEMDAARTTSARAYTRTCKPLSSPVAYHARTHARTHTLKRRLNYRKPCSLTKQSMGMTVS